MNGDSRRPHPDIREGELCTGDDYVWYGGRYEAGTCPIAVCPEWYEETMWWFGATHRNSETGWTMVHLPGPGAVGEQDALTMARLSAIRSELNEITSEKRRVE